MRLAHLLPGTRQRPPGAPDERQAAAASGELERHEQIAVDFVEHVAADDAAVGNAAPDIERVARLCDFPRDLLNDERLLERFADEARDLEQRGDDFPLLRF